MITFHLDHPVVCDSCGEIKLHRTRVYGRGALISGRKNFPALRIANYAEQINSKLKIKFIIETKIYQYIIRNGTYAA